MTKPAPKTVDEYIAAQPKEVQPILERVRKTIRKAVEAEETISYKIPTYKIGREPVLYFAAWKDVYSIYPATGRLRAAFKEQLAAHDVRKSTIRFRYADAVPVRLLARLAEFRAKEVLRKEKTTQI